ncbi:iron ABC transporter permease [Rhodobacteraceae bacterium]|nr:iron ABC transporter permease [Paracoccaceae bacterium]
MSATRMWSAFALGVAALVLAPIIAVIGIALHPTENIWPHLISTALPRYLGNTAILALGVGLLTAMIGAGAGWLVSIYRFPGRRWLEWALLFPLAVPAYVGAYALVDFLDYSGPLQILLRETFGWNNAQDYWFPVIRSRWAAVLVLAFAFYPYAYLLARNAFHEQSGASFEVARALGCGPVSLFWRVGLPLARPAIVAGAAIAMMEAVADFGVVDYFGVQTLTTGIFTTWLEAGNAGGAAQIALVILGVVFALFAVEKIGRRHARYYQSARQSRPISRIPLTPWAGWTAFGLCLIPVVAGFVLPVAVIGAHAIANAQAWGGAGLVRAVYHTLVTGGVAAALCVTVALVMVYGVRLSGRGLVRAVLPLTALGYAAPGAVLAVGILIPLAAVDHRLADGIWAVTGRDPGLLLTGSGFAIILAYIVRFFALAQGAADSAFGRVPPSLPMAARSLGRSLGQVLRQIYVPLMRSSVGSALLLVFVECVKELPATMLLRPFNYETLATRVHEKASLENLGDASPPALLVMGVGLLAMLVLARTNLRKLR